MSLFRHLHAATIAKYEGIPGPEPSLPLGNLGEFVTRWPWEACAEWGRNYGPVTLIWMFGSPAIVLNDPRLIEHVLTSDDYYKRDPRDAVAPVIGPDDLFISNGAEWSQLRWSNPFSQEYAPGWMRAQTPQWCQFAAKSTESWIGQSVEDTNDIVLRLIYDLIALAVWGEPLGDASFEHFMGMARCGNLRMLAPAGLQKIPPLDPFFYRDRDHWNNDFLARAARPAPEHSLLALAQKSSSLSPQALVGALAAPIFFGGAFSVTASITHTLRFLARAPDWQTRVRDELDGRCSASAGVEYDALVGSQHLDHTLREAQRLSPPVAIFSRCVKNDRTVELGGYKLPPDTNLLISNWLLHHDETHWPDPWAYRPDRWENGGVERDPYGSDYFFPFGRGPRACIGQSFSHVLCLIVLSTMLSRLNIEIDCTGELKSEFFFAVQSPKQLAATFTAR